MYFLFSKAGNFETSITRVPYNKLLTNLACSSRTGEYWPSVVFVRTSLRSVRTATTSGQYSPRARLVRGYYTDYSKKSISYKIDERGPYFYKLCNIQKHLESKVERVHYSAGLVHKQAPTLSQCFCNCKRL